MELKVTKLLEKVQRVFINSTTAKGTNVVDKEITSVLNTAWKYIGGNK